MNAYNHSGVRGKLLDMNIDKSLVDPFGRKIEYVRLSVTDKCDLRCFYCLPKAFKNFKEPEHWLTYDEIIRVIAAFSDLGVNRVRITGGEPLVRKNLPELVSRLHRIPGVNDLSLSTNAVQLSKHAESLKQAGLSRLNVSLDSLDPKRFKSITGGKLEKVLAGLQAAKMAGFKPIKINMVMMNGINEDEVNNMVQFCIDHDFTLRFIETMPIGDTGRSATDHYISLDVIKSRLEEKFDMMSGVMPGGGPAKYMQVAGTDLRIGFITPISQHFCESCNRVRLSVDGILYLCLGQNDKVELRPLLRKGIGDDELRDVILHAISLKPERHFFNDKPGQVVRFMSMTGG